MDASKNFAAKKRVSNVIFTGIVVMVIVFVISLLLPKEWLVTGRIVVFPSGQPASATANLLAETGNTAQILASESFRKNYIGDKDSNFAGARVMKNSSMVLVKFRSNENDIQTYEDTIVKIPSQLSEYTRDLYDGAPFKYKMAADPEISASPVRPNLLMNAIFGFLGGVILYLIYWYGFEGKETPVEEEIDSEPKEEKKETKIVSPKIEAEKPSEEKVGEGKVVMENGRPAFVPGKKEINSSAAPENLPFIDEQDQSSEIAEPSDEEVKERLNRLMRGEL